jgi:hypothetical protein
MSAQRDHPSQTSAKLTLLFGVFLVLVALSTLIAVTHVTDLHHDEHLVYRFSEGTLVETIQYLAFQDVHPPLWFSSFWLWKNLVGTGEFTGRLQAILFALLTISLVYRLGREWFRSWVTGALAAAVLLTNAYFLAYAVEIRPYSAGMFLATLSMLLFMGWLKTGRWRYGVGYAVIAAAMLYVHYFLAFVLVAQTLYWLIQLVSATRSGTGARPLRRVWPHPAMLLLAAALWLPMLPVFVSQVNVLRQLAIEAGNAAASGLGTPATTAATNLTTLTRLVTLATNGLWPLYLAALLLAGLARKRYRYTGLTWWWALGIPAISLVINIWAAVYTPRYVVSMVVGLALLTALGLSFLPRRWMLTAGALFVIANGLTASQHLPQRIPYRDIFRAISASALPGDVIAFVDGNTDDTVKRWNEAAYLTGLPDRRDHPTPESLESVRRVWFITGDLFAPDVEAWFRALEPTHPVQTVLGDCNRQWCYVAQLMEAPPLTEPIVFGDVLPFYGADVDAVTGTSIELRLWWRVDAPLSADWSIGVQLLDETGRLVSQQDGPIRHYGIDTVQTSQLQPGKIYMDVRSVPLPASVPEGTYRLVLVVYQPWDGTRITTGDGSDMVELSQIPLGQ